ncbi:hypothetical protein BDC45DRAFT_445832 [Circinella umbellata]|nr:hypothetical protein BDC45DRAFT_445832 [Circinella umbellata]
MDKMTRWLETAQMAVFSLELSLKEDQTSSILSFDDDQLLELTFGRMEPLMSILVEVGNIVEDKLDMEDTAGVTMTKKMHTRMSITKIQSEWSGLQHFMSSVLKQLDTMNEKKELTLLMENVLQQIDDLSIMMFQFQEKRHAAAIDEHILAEIDRKVEPLFNDVQRIYGSMTSHTPPEDPSGMLTRKHHMVQHRWETLRIEIDDLKEELKEDRWLVVFRQVADQVDVMIDGLDKTVTQCYTIIDQVLSSPSSSSTTMSSSSSPPVDLKKFRSVEKNFEAKYKYYTPSIGKMLGMLGNGIVSRVARNNGTNKRHSAMMQRWTTLKSSMDMLRNKDLPETDRMLTEGISMAYARDMRPSASESSSTDYLHNTRRTMTPMGTSTNNNNHESRSFATRKSRVPNNSRDNDKDQEASWMKPTKSTLMRTARKTQSVDQNLHQQQQNNRPKTPTSAPPQRSKTPTPSYTPRKSTTPNIPNRPKSSLGRQQQQQQLFVPEYDDNDNNDQMYIPNPKDPLDREVARIVNASPISVKCSKGPLGGGRYFFGNELNPSVGGGRKLYTCKLMTYENNNNSQRRSKPAQNKVLIRIGGGFEDLELFLLRYGTL